MAFNRREYQGAAASTTLSSDITSGSSSIVAASGTGYPTGAVGPFVIVLDPGLPGEEKVLCSARTSGTFTVTTRGYDGTSAAAHTAACVIQHVITAVDMDEANQHYSDITVDNHTQYLNVARHDLAARHTFGAALGTPAAPADVGTVAGAGAGTVPPRSDHVHRLGNSAVDVAAVLGSNVVTTAKILDANVTNAKLAPDSVTTDKIADGAVGYGDLNAAAVSNIRGVVLTDNFLLMGA